MKYELDNQSHRNGDLPSFRCFVVASRLQRLFAVLVVCALTAANAGQAQAVERLRIVGASLGIALFPEHGAEDHVLVQHADAAMYSTKRSKSGFALYGDASVTAESTRVTRILIT